jgi:hypothetical protein
VRGPAETLGLAAEGTPKLPWGMTELDLLSTVGRYPHRAALARRGGIAAVSLFSALRRLEAEGLVVRRRESYLLTTRGKRELDIGRALARLVVQALRSNTSAAQPSSTSVSTRVQPEWRGASPSR